MHARQGVDERNYYETVRQSSYFSGASHPNCWKITNITLVNFLKPYICLWLSPRSRPHAHLIDLAQQHFF